MTPHEIMRTYPIGRILELSPETKQRIKFLAICLESVDLAQRKLQERLGNLHALGTPVTGDQITEVIDDMLAAQPLEGMLSISLGNGWNDGNAYLHAKNASTVLRKVIWSLLYASVAEDYSMDRPTWLKLKLSLLENPPGGGLLVRGYEFSEKELGHEGNRNRPPDICPDFPPSNILNQRDDDEEQRA